MADCRDWWHSKFKIGDKVRLTKGLLNGDPRLKSGTEFYVKEIERKEVRTGDGAVYITYAYSDRKNPLDRCNTECVVPNGILIEERALEKVEDKYWTGKVICTENGIEEHGVFLYWSGNPFFTVGKVYKVIDGRIMHDGTKGGEIISFSPQLVTSLENLLDPSSIECPPCCRFIEYKGGAEE